MLELEEGIMRVIAGPEKKTRVMSEKERLVTAYHELGHAIVGHTLEHADPVHKVSIISRGQALGYTISLPTEDKFLTTRAELNDTMAMTLGGRAAEEIIFEEITTGASNDLEKVTETAKQMVMRFGMSDRLGPRVFGHDRGQPFLGREFSAEPDYSDEVAREIDDEIRRMVEEAHQAAKKILTKHRKELDNISKILLERETIEAEEFVALLEGKPEDEVFADDEEETPEPPEAEAEKSSAREGARPRVQPKPGLAGGGAAEMRGDESGLKRQSPRIERPGFRVRVVNRLTGTVSYTNVFATCAALVVLGGGNRRRRDRRKRWGTLGAGQPRRRAPSAWGSTAGPPSWEKPSASGSRRSERSLASRFPTWKSRAQSRGRIRRFTTSPPTRSRPRR